MAFIADKRQLFNYVLIFKSGQIFKLINMFASFVKCFRLHFQYIAICYKINSFTYSLFCKKVKKSVIQNKSIQTNIPDTKGF